MSEHPAGGQVLDVGQMDRMDEGEARRWRVPVQGLGEGLMRLGERLRPTAKGSPGVGRAAPR